MNRLAGSKKSLSGPVYDVDFDLVGDAGEAQYRVARTVNARHPGLGLLFTVAKKAGKTQSALVAELLTAGAKRILKGETEDGRRPLQDEVLTAVAGAQRPPGEPEGPQGERVVAAAAPALGVLSQ